MLPPELLVQLVDSSTCPQDVAVVLREVCQLLSGEVTQKLLPQWREVGLSIFRNAGVLDILKWLEEMYHFSKDEIEISSGILCAPYHDAIQMNNLDLVKWLHETYKFEAYDLCDVSHSFAGTLAVKLGRLEILKWFHETGQLKKPDYMAYDFFIEDLHLLHMSLAAGHLDVVDWLVTTFYQDKELLYNTLTYLYKSSFNHSSSIQHLYNIIPPHSEYEVVQVKCLFLQSLFKTGVQKALQWFYDTVGFTRNDLYYEYLSGRYNVNIVAEFCGQAKDTDLPTLQLLHKLVTLKRKDFIGQEYEGVRRVIHNGNLETLQWIHSTFHLQPDCGEVNNLLFAIFQEATTFRMDILIWVCKTFPTFYFPFACDSAACLGSIEALEFLFGLQEPTQQVMDKSLNYALQWCHEDVADWIYDYSQQKVSHDYCNRMDISISE